MDTLRVVSFLAPSVRPVYEALAGYFGEALGVRAEFRSAASYSELLSEATDIAFVCSVPYLKESEKPEPALEVIGAPVLVGGRYEGRPIYFSDVITQRKSKLKSFKKMKGKRWAYNEPFSHSGYHVVRYELASMGETNGFFGEVVEAGYHSKAIEMVAAGEVDGAAIDTQVLEIALRDNPVLAAQVKVIETLGPSTIQPVVAASRLPLTLKTELRDALMIAGAFPQVAEAYNRCLVRRFEPMADSDFDDIRKMLLIADQAGITQLR
jgi:phosphonate transport system substrate-binding protein